VGPGGVTQRRVLAYLIDAFLVLWVLQFLLFLIIAEQSDLAGRGRSIFDGLFLSLSVTRQGMVFGLNGNDFLLRDDRYAVYILACLGAWFLYFGVLQGLTGRTLGKLMSGLRVVQGNGEPLGLGRGIVRALFLLVDGFPWGTGALGFIVVVANERRRRIGDMVANTDVVLAHPEVAPVGPDALYSGTGPAPPAPVPPPPPA
jgi:uncharacterized RDD family membrane protein YckC